jgi:hypothetical protein
LNLNVRNWFQNLLSNGVNLCRYAEVDTLQQESEMPIHRLLQMYGAPKTEVRAAAVAAVTPGPAGGGSGGGASVSGGAAGKKADGIGGDDDQDDGDDSSSDTDASDSDDDDDDDDDDDFDDEGEDEDVGDQKTTPGGTRRQSITVAGMERPPPPALAPGHEPITYATREEARAAAMEEARRIHYEEEVQVRAENILARPPRTKPMPSFPEPARNKVHWDHLLEEMRWLAGDFVRERKFRQKLARKAVYAVVGGRTVF